MSLIQQIAIFLGAAVLMVPLFKRLGLGAVLGYLAAGVLIGPSGFGVISDVTAIYHFAEFGIVLLLIAGIDTNIPFHLALLDRFLRSRNRSRLCNPPSSRFGDGRRRSSHFHWGGRES